MSGWYLLPWSQTNVARLPSGRAAPVVVGTVWSWQGQATRVDQPHLVEKIDFNEDVYAQTVALVQSLVFSAVGDLDEHAPKPKGFVVSDGGAEYRIAEVDAGPDRSSLLLFVDHVPPVNTDLKVIRKLDRAEKVQPKMSSDHSLVTLGADVWLRGPNGLKRAGDLQEGNEIDAGGEKHVTVLAVRKAEGPAGRPVVLRKDALGPATPRNDMVLSPSTSVLLQGQAAEMLFGESQAFVACEDLVNSRTILPVPEGEAADLVELEISTPCVIYANGIQVRADRQS